MNPAPDLQRLWLAALQGVVGRAAHDVRDALNGVSLNLEVIRSRAARRISDPGGGPKPGTAGAAAGNPAALFGPFAEAASEQLGLVSARMESLLFLGRAHRAASGTVDVAETLKHLATLLVPAAKADGGSLTVQYEGRGATTTSASPEAVRLALAAGLLAHMRDGGAVRCTLAAGDDLVVRFSHESAGGCSLDPAAVKAIAGERIRCEGSSSDLVVVFPVSQSH